MNKALQYQIDYSIDVLRKSEGLALKMHPEGFHLAFSGGKDSQVLYHLAEMAGVKFVAHMQITTLDPPELMRFVRKNYPNVVMHRPEINFYDLIKKKGMLPLRQARYCCAYLKEQAGKGTVTLLGIRAEESAKRAKRTEMEYRDQHTTWDQFNRVAEAQFECMGGAEKIMISPILKWRRSQVWEFIRENQIKYCELYDQGFHRIGCLFCPMASTKEKQMERRRYPRIEAKIKESIQYIIDNNGYMNNHGTPTADEVFNWWVSNDTSEKYFGMKDQLKLF